MSSLFSSGVRPVIDAYLLKKAQEQRDYGDYWSASSAGYCMRKVIFDRLGVPPVKEDARKHRVFESGHIFHQWVQGLTDEAGISVAQEIELIDDKLMIKGHFDDLVLVDGKLLLYDYKTQNSRAFSYKRPEMSHFHRYQLGTYMYIIRKLQSEPVKPAWLDNLPELTEARIMKISKDDLRMGEEQLLWSTGLEKEVVGYWATLNGYWASKKLPKCTCADFEGGFMSREAYNGFYFEGEPCSIKWYEKCKKEGLLK